MYHKVHMATNQWLISMYNYRGSFESTILPIVRFPIHTKKPKFLAIVQVLKKSFLEKVDFEN